MSKSTVSFIPRLRERWRQVEVEVVINSSNTILKTWELLLATQVAVTMEVAGRSVGRTDRRARAAGRRRAAIRVRSDSYGTVTDGQGCGYALLPSSLAKEHCTAQETAMRDG